MTKNCINLDEMKADFLRRYYPSTRSKNQDQAIADMLSRMGAMEKELNTKR